MRLFLESPVKDQGRATLWNEKEAAGAIMGAQTFLKIDLRNYSRHITEQL